MKAIIPVAGIGSKLRPHTHTQPKALVPVAGKAILAHIIDSLIDAGINDFVFIVGYLSDKIESYIRNHYPDLKKSFVLQEPREGLAHAIYVTRHEIQDDEEILILLGDTIVNLDVKEFIGSKTSMLGVKKVSTPGLFGVVELDSDGDVKRLVEKPKIPKSNLALVGIYKISNAKLLKESVAALIEEKQKNRGEYQLTDALMKMVNEGEVFRTVVVDNWFDCGRKESLLEANSILMNRATYKRKNKWPEFPNTIIIEPVSIGPGCLISNSIIGPDVAIGESTIINYSIVRNSIIGSFSELKSAVMESSIVGNDTALKGLSQSLNIGDNTEINFNS